MPTEIGTSSATDLESGTSYAPRPPLNASLDNTGAFYNFCIYQNPLVVAPQVLLPSALLPTLSILSRALPIPMYSPSHLSLEDTQQCPCCSARSSDSFHRSSDSLYRPAIQGASVTTLSDVGSKSSKMRYGGRGGAGSRLRSIPQPSPKGHSLPRSRSSNFRTKWTSVSSADVLRDVPPPVPAIPIASFAERRGAANIPSPLVLRASSPIVLDNTPPLSATTHTSATDGDFPNTPRTPYFYFDEAFDGRCVQSPPPSPSTSGSMRRTLRRLASRTQRLFVKDRSQKTPPPVPALPSPISSTHDRPAPSIPPTSPSETSPTSEWFDAPEVHPATPETCSSPEPPLVPEPDPLSAPIVVELPGRVRSASSATVKAPGCKPTGERKHRERRRTRGEWNNEMGEVIVALRLLK
ncbi:hypothetical protein B0H12DRAFT_1112719 [Mycena haematopus]|nr:hypothetical protein B0H12DRAFT_1112719 [Mycena haematopus]